MAKGNFMLGKFRGKLGGTVFRVDPDAGQVASEYNDHPSNPRTVPQTLQRNKMNLAGQMSKLTPYSAIAGLSSSRRMARSMFVSTIIKNAANTALSSTGRASAYIEKEKVVLSRGIIYDVAASGVINAAQNKVTITVTNNDDEEIVMGARVVVYGFVDNLLHACYVKNVTFSAGAQTQSVDIAVAPGVLSDVADFNIYVIPVVAVSADARTLYEQGVTNYQENGDFSAAVDRSLSMLNAFGGSAFAQKVSTE